MNAPKGPVWGPNLKEFQKRFNPETTKGEGQKWLKNLYFLYLIELRALAKAGTQLSMTKFFTGNRTEDNMVRKKVGSLVNIARYGVNIYCFYCIYICL